MIAELLRGGGETERQLNDGQTVQGALIGLIKHGMD